MADGATPSTQDDAAALAGRSNPPLEAAIERLIFASRWLMVPVYIGLIACLAILIFVFFRELWLSLPQVAPAGRPSRSPPWTRRMRFCWCRR